MACKICETRRARRSCPAVGGDICPVCCGTSRENTLSCPLDCVYLRQAREHEKPRPIDPKAIPNADVRVTNEFVDQHSDLISALIRGVAIAGLGLPGAADADVRDALDSLTQTYRTLQSGLYYESKPQNLLAARLHEMVQKGFEEYRKAAAEQFSGSPVRDADILGGLVFLQRLAYQFDNGRPRGRAFLDFLRQHTPANDRQPGAGAVSSLVLP